MKLENVCIYRHKSFVPLDMSRCKAPMKFLNILLLNDKCCSKLSLHALGFVIIYQNWLEISRDIWPSWTSFQSARNVVLERQRLRSLIYGYTCILYTVQDSCFGIFGLDPNKLWNFLRYSLKQAYIRNSS